MVPTMTWGCGWSRPVWIRRRRRFRWGASILYTVAPDQEIRDVRTLMRTHGIRQVPVVDHGDIVGVVTLADLAFADDGGTVLAIMGPPTRRSCPRGPWRVSRSGGTGHDPHPAPG